MQKEDKLTESDIKEWIKRSYIMFYSFDKPGFYIHRTKKVGCYERFIVNFNVKTGKLLVYVSDEKNPKKRVLFVTTSKQELNKKDLCEVYTIICPYTKGVIRNIGRR